MDLALNNLQRLICHKTSQTKPTIIKNLINKHNLFLLHVWYLLKYFFNIKQVLIIKGFPDFVTDNQIYKILEKNNL